MKKSSSTSMLSELLQSAAATDHMIRIGSSSDDDDERQRRGLGGGVAGVRGDRNVRGTGLQGKRNLSSSNASLPGDIALSTMPWASPIRRQPLSSPIPLMRINSPTSRQHRVEQLRKEESVDERIREVEQDREVTSQLHLNQSCVDLKIDDDDHMMMETAPYPIACSSTITSFISPSSPVYPSRMRSRSLTPTSPSSSRSFTYRRSLSPVPMRPSSLCFEPRKRKRNSDLEEMDISPTQLNPPAKRAVFASPLALSPPLSSSLTPPHNDLRPAFDTPSLVTAPFAPRPLLPTYVGGGLASFDQQSLPHFSHVRKRVNIPGSVTLNSHSTPMDSAFHPFKHSCSDPLPPPPCPPSLEKGGDSFETLSSNSFHPVTTIS